MTFSSIKFTQGFFAATALCLAVGCGGTAIGPGGGGSPEGGPPSLGPCASSGDCPSGSACYFPVGDCSAKGQCIALDSSGPVCGAIEYLCGCGTMATSGCGFPDGYASAPALSGGTCDPLPPIPSSGGTLGLCGDGGTCPSGSSCYFPIGSCSARGECIADPPSSAPTCGAIESLCGCGSSVETGCGFPDGYASGPTTGASFCAVDGGSGTSSGSVPPHHTGG